jgi:phosphatidylinositol 3-kinase
MQQQHGQSRSPRFEGKGYGGEEEHSVDARSVGGGGGHSPSHGPGAAGSSHTHVDKYTHIPPLAKFLITRACSSKSLASFLWWYVRVEIETDTTGLFRRVLVSMAYSMARHSAPNNTLVKQMLGLDEFLENISNCQLEARQQMAWLSLGDKYAKVKEKLNSLFESRQLTKVPTYLLDQGITSVPNPLNPSIYLLGVEKCSHVFKSKMLPVVVNMSAVNDPYSSTGGVGDAAIGASGSSEGGSGSGGSGGSRLISSITSSAVSAITTVAAAVGVEKHESSAASAGAAAQHSASSASSTAPHNAVVPSFTQKLFFKQGDDLRTDQLILNLFTLMDSLLKKVNLDMKMKIFSVIATRTRVGLMEFVDKSSTVQDITDKYGSIRNYFMQKNTKNPGVLDPGVLDTFIKSTAGSCVMTYILAIGDRHLENILITEQGQLFHLDFGFVFGKDPKPMPSPFRLTKEMAVAIGGEQYMTSENFNKFRSYCHQAYNWLRKSSNLVTNLLSLMDERGIISDEKPMPIPEVLKVVEERLMLELTDEEAETHFSSQIEIAITAWAPKLAEYAHIIRMKLK